MTGILIWVGTALVGALLGLFVRPRTIAIFCAFAFSLAVAGVVIGYSTGNGAVGFMSGVATMAIAFLGALLVGGSAVIRALWRRSEPDTPARAVPAENALPDTEATLEALRSYRNGELVTARCPTCGSSLAVTKSKPKPGRNPAAVRVSCVCGQSNGFYEFREKNA